MNSNQKSAPRPGMAASRRRGSTILAIMICVGAGTAAGQPGPECEQPLPNCPWDVAPDGGDGVVNINDLMAVINSWGQTGPPRPVGDCAPEPNGDCTVDVDDLLAVISHWRPCPPPFGACCFSSVLCIELAQDACEASGGTFQGDETTCATVVCPATVDLDVDTERDNDVDSADETDEDKWTRTRGAFYIVNCDDDDNDDKSDSVEFGKMIPNPTPPPAMIFAPEVINIIDDKINNADDTLDITPLVIRAFDDLTNKTVKLKIASLEQIKAVHVFEQIVASTPAQTKFWGGPDETAIEKDITAMVSTTADRTFGIEGLKFRCVNTAAGIPFAAGHDMLFDGFVQFELQLIDNASGNVLSDKVLLKVAPVILLPNSRTSTEVYVQDKGGTNLAFRDAFKNNLPLNHVKEYTTDTQWVQDDVEIGYTQTPRSKMHVTLYTRHHGSQDDPVPVGAQSIGDAKFIRQYLLEKNRGIYRNPGFDDPSVDSFDYGGNLELLSPTGKHELGRINFGKDMSAKKRQFLASQEAQPPYDVDTEWLVVGHVDEFIAYVREAQGGANLTVVLASPTKAYSIIDNAFPPPSESENGPPLEEDPGVIFARSASGGVPLTESGVAELATPASIVDLEKNFIGDEPYQYVRIYEGPGEGQIAHVLETVGNMILVDMVWAPFDPTSFFLAAPGPGDEPCAGLECFYYSTPSSAQWFTIPGPGSKYILIEDTQFWNSGPTPLAGLPTGIPASVTAKEVKDKFPDLRTVNTKAQEKIDAAKALIEAAALQADGTPQAITFKEVPVLYTGKLVGTPPALQNRETFAWAPGAANIQFAHKPGDPLPVRSFVAKQNVDKGGTELFGADINTTLTTIAGMKVVFADDFDLYHKLTGEVHCGSNVLREIFDFNWWTKQPDSVPALP